MCRVLEVSKAGYYKWRGRKETAHSKKDAALRLQILSIHKDSRRIYGCPRIHFELHKSGVRISRNRVARLMRMEAIKGKKRSQSRAKTISTLSEGIADNILNRRFNPSLPNRAWVADITNLPTKEGWLYLATVIDLFSRRVVGWAMSKYIDAELVLAALQMAVKARRPDVGLLVHTDRGSQYSSREHRAYIAANGIVASMSRKGNCWDNAVAESFFSTLKVETKPKHVWATRSEARSMIFEYIEVWYNRKRRHSSNQYLSPAEFEATRPVA